MKKFNKSAALLAAAGLISALGIGGTLAYLTDSEQHTNVFTVGDVSIDLEEPNYVALTALQKTNIVPNQELAKDPFIKNTGVNDSIVFMKLTVPVENVTLVADNGANSEKKAQEIFYFKDTADYIETHANNFDSEWLELPTVEANTGSSTAQTVGTRTYVFAYKRALPGSLDSSGLTGSADTSKLFDKIQFKNILEEEIAQGALEKIKVEAFAIQTNNILLSNASTTHAAFDPIAANMTEQNLIEIYNIFIRQASQVTENGNSMTADEKVAEADTNNTYGLAGGELSEYTSANPSKEAPASN